MNKPSNRAGRPPLYATPEALQGGVDAYFDHCEAKKAPPTMGELCLFLGFHKRDALLAYERRSEEFSYIVGRARLQMEDDRNQRLLAGGRNVVGIIFDLKNHFGWKNRTERQVELDIDLSTFDDAELESIAKTGRLPAKRSARLA